MKAILILVFLIGISISCKEPLQVEEQPLLAKCPDNVYTVPINNTLQLVKIEDNNFEKYLIEQNYDTDKTPNGLMSITDALKVEIISISSRSVWEPSNDIIKSVKGIEYFKNLKSFSSTNELVEAIDFSHNINLESINISENSLLYIENETNKYKALKFINLGTNVKLKYLNIGNVILKELDISNTPNIEEFRVWSNSLETIYVKNEQQINPEALKVYKSKGEYRIMTPPNWGVYNHKGNVDYKVCN